MSIQTKKKFKMKKILIATMLKCVKKKIICIINLKEKKSNFFNKGFRVNVIVHLFNIIDYFDRILKKKKKYDY